MNGRRVVGFVGMVVVLVVLVALQPGKARGQAVAVVGEGIVSTDGNETFPAQDPRTGALWFSVYESSFAGQTIVFASRTATGWSEPQVAPFSGRWGDRAPRFSPDGSALFFTSNRPREEGGEPGDMNIWRVRRVDDGWGEPEILAAPFNSDAEDIHAAVTPDGLWLASNRPGGRGRSDIYRISWGGEVLHPGATVNDELSQPDLWVSEDETVMILAITDHPRGLGGDDLYISRFDGSSWSVPENLGPRVNTEEYEYGPTVSADGRWLYFTSHRSGSADVYRVPLADVTGGR